MSFSWRQYVLPAAAIVGLAGAGIEFASWLRAHDAWVRLEQELKDHDARIAQIESRQETREKETTQKVRAIERNKKEVRTPEQIIARLPEYLPLPEAPVLVTPPATPEELKPRPQLILPPEDIKPLYDFAADCASSKVKLATCEANLADEKEIGKELREERDSAVKAAKGGRGFWSNVKTALKWMAIGGAIAGGALCGTGHCK